MGLFVCCVWNDRPCHFVESRGLEALSDDFASKDQNKN